MEYPIEGQLALRPDERLLWSGGPDPRVRFTAADAPFSIVWCAFMIRWDVGAVAERAPVFFYLVGAVLTAVGLYLLVGRFAYRHYRKTRTVYGVTAGRAIIAGPGLLTDMPLREQPVTYRPSRNWRHVSVAIGDYSQRLQRPGFTRDRLFTWSNGNTGLEGLLKSGAPPFAFYDVADPDSLLRALQQAGAHVRRLGQ